ncbi:hypothetical protein BB559_001694, partial [Furculomyces boomerangus]
PSESIPSDTIPSESVPSDTIPPQSAPSDTTASNTVPSESIPSDTIPSESVPSDTVPSESVPSDTVPSESVPSDTIPSQSVPSDTVSSESTTSDAIPPESIPSDTIPSQSVPSDTTASNTVPSESIPSDTIPPQSVPSDTIPSDTIPPQSAPSDTIPSDTIPPQSAPSDTIPSDAISPESVPSDTIPSESVPSNTIPSESVPSDTTPSKSTPSDTTPTSSQSSESSTKAPIITVNTNDFVPNTRTTVSIPTSININALTANPSETHKADVPVSNPNETEQDSAPSDTEPIPDPPIINPNYVPCSQGCLKFTVRILAPYGNLLSGNDNLLPAQIINQLPNDIGVGIGLSDPSRIKASQIRSPYSTPGLSKNYSGSKIKLGHVNSKFRDASVSNQNYFYVDMDVLKSSKVIDYVKELKNVEGEIKNSIGNSDSNLYRVSKLTSLIDPSYIDVSSPTLLVNSGKARFPNDPTSIVSPFEGNKKGGFMAAGICVVVVLYGSLMYMWNRLVDKRQFKRSYIMERHRSKERTRESSPDRNRNRYRNRNKSRSPRSKRDFRENTHETKKFHNDYSKENKNSNDNEKDKEKDEEEEKIEPKPNFGLSGKLATDTNVVNGALVKYNEPAEARKPKERWRLYVFKANDQIDLLKVHDSSAYLFGRDRRIADIPVDHPSCSGQHAVLQYRQIVEKRDGESYTEIRPYIIDLGSTNGTFVNGNKIPVQRYYELLPQDVLKFGFSTREFVLMHEELA